jgi:spore coat polysaccharide biosynthesis protein SpsF
MGSTRLPGKVLKPFCGVPMLQFQLDLLKKYNTGFEIVVATTENSNDQKIIQLCEKLGCKYFVGSETDVFSRYRMVAKEFKFNHVIRLTGDNPLVSYNILKNSVKSHLKNNCDLTSTRELFTDGSIKRYAPKGLSMDIINCRTMLGINSSSLNSFEKEHLIPVFFNGDYSVNIFKPSIQYTVELSIDTIQEFDRVQSFANSLINNGKLYEYLGFYE